MAIEVFVGQFGPNSKQYWGTAKPSASGDLGPYNVGDIMWNTAPAIGAVPFWMCSSAGPTGATSTWVAAAVLTA